MPTHESGNQPEKRKARNAMVEIAVRALGGLLARLLEGIVHELFNWPDS